MAEPRPIRPREAPRELPDPLLEAFIGLARSAIANRRAAEQARRTIRVVTTDAADRG